MLLREKLTGQLGNLFFKYRGEQYFLYVLIILLEFKKYYNSQTSLVYQIICFGVCCLGTLVRVLTIGYIAPDTSGRNRTGQVAESLNTTGIYSMVRNPLYVGNYIILLGMLMLTKSIDIIVLNTIAFFALYIPIILTEENFLFDKFKEQYREYTDKVNCMIPSFKNFKKPETGFNIITVLRREHDTWLTTVVGFLAVNIFIVSIQMHKLIYINPFWLLVLGLVFIIWFILKKLKKAGKLSSD